MTYSETYKSAGVDLDAADLAKRKIAALAKSTFSDDVASEIGAFGGVYRYPTGSDSLLLASADGVGTKIKVATAAGIYNTVGQDLVNHCINDILTLGAEPIFFLDYIGYSDLTPDIISQIVEGLSIACRENQLSLIGGETAQMPGLYSPGDFDLVGFIVGYVHESGLITGDAIEPGNAIIALPSNGLQTNGFSLARKVLLDSGKYCLDDRPELLGGISVGEALLAIHPSYKKQVTTLVSAGFVRGMAHITGGGIPGNLVRVLPEGCAANVDVSAVSVPAVFELIRRAGEIPSDEMHRVFNMGAGFLIIIDSDAVSKAISMLNQSGSDAVPCGKIVAGAKKIIIEETS